MSKQIKHIHLLGVCGTAMGSTLSTSADAEIETTISARNLANGDNNLIICVQKNKQKTSPKEYAFETFTVKKHGGGGV